MVLVELLFYFGVVFGQELDVLNNFNFEVMKNWRNDCSKRAIQELIPQCYEGIESITPEQQKILAIDLSICEFENANIEYPSPCKERNMDTCIQFLEKSPQFWTTFSGYYREVKTICHQLSLPFEKDQILLVYENMTELYKSLIQDLRSTNKQSEEAQSILKSKFDKLINIVDSIIADRSRDQDDLNQSFSMFQESFESSLNNAVVILQHSYNGANTNIKEMEQHLNYFAQELFQVHMLMKDKMSELELQQEKLQENNDNILDKTEKTLDKLEVINKNINDMNEVNSDIAMGVQTHLEYFEFSVISLNSHIQQSINDIESQRKYIDLQGPLILKSITENFVQQLNHSASEIVVSIEGVVNGTLEKLNNKMKETEDSLENINLKTLKFVSMVESMSNYLSTLIKFPKVFKNIASNMVAKVKFWGKSVSIIMVILFLILILPFCKIFKYFPLKICLALYSDFGPIVASISIGVISAIVILLTLKADNSIGNIE